MLALCDRFHALPSQVYEEDISVLRMIRVAALEGGEQPGGQ